MLSFDPGTYMHNWDAHHLYSYIVSLIFFNSSLSWNFWNSIRSSSSKQKQEQTHTHDVWFLMKRTHLVFEFEFIFSTYAILKKRKREREKYLSFDDVDDWLNESQKQNMEILCLSKQNKRRSVSHKIQRAIYKLNYNRNQYKNNNNDAYTHI